MTRNDRKKLHVENKEIKHEVFTRGKTFLLYSPIQASLDEFEQMKFKECSSRKKITKRRNYLDYFNCDLQNIKSMNIVLS
jgi:hypothetical protein